jgi:rare lipoprotein A
LIHAYALAATSAIWGAAAAFSACAGTPSSARAQHGGHVSATADPPEQMPASLKPLRTMHGKASYYSDKFSGRKTASGEPYDPSRRTAANRDLPLGTIVRVTRQDTGAQVIVRVNDRGPFNDKRRLLDLSRAAAKQLDMIGRGVISVKVEVLELGKQSKRHKH